MFNAKVSCFHGLKELEARKYGLAARHFIEVSIECDVGLERLFVV